MNIVLVPDELKEVILEITIGHQTFCYCTAENESFITAIRSTLFTLRISAHQGHDV